MIIPNIYWKYTDYPILCERIFSFEGIKTTARGTSIVCLFEDRTNKPGVLYFGEVIYEDISVKRGEDYAHT